MHQNQKLESSSFQQVTVKKVGAKKRLNKQHTFILFSKGKPLAEVISSTEGPFIMFKRNIEVPSSIYETNNENSEINCSEVFNWDNVQIETSSSQNGYDIDYPDELPSSSDSQEEEEESPSGSEADEDSCGDIESEDEESENYLRSWGNTVILYYVRQLLISVWDFHPRGDAEHDQKQMEHLFNYISHIEETENHN